MNFKTEIEHFTTHQIIFLISSILVNVSDENLIRLTYLAEKLTGDQEVLSGIRGVRAYLNDPDHPTKKLFHRVLNHLTPENRRVIFETLFYRGWFLGGKKRDAFEKKYGFRPPFVMILSPTFHCNLRCKGCYTLGYGTKPELPYEIVNSVLTECEEMGIYFVTVLGGEPLVYPHLFRMIEAHPEIFFQVYTFAEGVKKEISEHLFITPDAMTIKNDYKK